jgi:hypothetical protein
MNCTKPSSPYIALLLIVLCVALIELPKRQTKIISMQEKQEQTITKLSAKVNLVELKAIKNLNHE